MAEDGYISAMWRSLVPTPEYTEGVGDVESPAVDHWNPHEAVGVRTYYPEAESSLPFHLQFHHQDAEPIYCPYQQQNLQYYPEPEVEITIDTQQARPSNSELIYHASDAAGEEAIDYDWNIYAMAQCFPENVDVKEVEFIRVGDGDDAVVVSDSHPAAAGQHLQKEDKNIIYRVPETMRRKNDKDNTPYVVTPTFMSIGPYHHGNKKFNEAVPYKFKFLNILREETQFSVRTYREMIIKEKLKEKVNKCYEKEKESGGGQDKEYDWLSSSWYLILDACFLLVSLGILPSKKVKVEPGKKKPLELKDLVDTVFKEEGDRPADFPSFIPSFELPFLSVPLVDFIHDVCLLENQIPFFTLEKAYKVALGKADTETEDDSLSVSLKKKVAKWLNKMLQLYPSAISRSEPHDFHHFLHYCHIYFKPSSLEQIGRSDDKNKNKKLNLSQWRFSARGLEEKGVNFRRIQNSEGRSLLDVKFTCSGMLNTPTLEIPILSLDGQTGTLFRNIIAFEQKSSDENISRLSKNYFTSYVKFMANLMPTAEDVSLLTKKRIIVNHLGKDERVLDLFNELMGGVNLKFDESNYLNPVYSRLEEVYESSLRENVADVRRTHLKNPAIIIATIAGIVAFVLTVLDFFGFSKKK